MCELCGVSEQTKLDSEALFSLGCEEEQDNDNRYFICCGQLGGPFFLVLFAKGNSSVTNI